jgi:hypothetical protein
MFFAGDVNAAPEAILRSPAIGHVRADHRDDQLLLLLIGLAATMFSVVEQRARWAMEDERNAPRRRRSTHWSPELTPTARQLKRPLRFVVPSEAAKQ